MELATIIEGMLFYKGEPMTISSLANFSKRPKNEVEDALATLEKRLEGTALTLVWSDTAVTLGTRAELSDALLELRRDELKRELSKATLETLAIIIYKRGATRGEVDYIRGVNSSFIVRNLLVRGLIERKVHESDSRKFVYMPTIDLLTYMGVARIDEMPEMEKFGAELTRVAAAEESSE